MTKGTKKYFIATAKYGAGTITSIVSGIFGVAAIIAGIDGHKAATDKKERKNYRDCVIGGVIISAASIITGIASSTTYQSDMDAISIDDYHKDDEKELFADDEESSYTSLSPEYLEELHRRKEELNKTSKESE